MDHNNQNTALLVMDVQGSIVKNLKDRISFFGAIKQAIQTARENIIPVIYIVVGFRKGYPEVSVNNKSFSRLKSGAMNLDTEESTKIDSTIEPLPGDVIITKKRISAFSGSDLEVVLRSFGVNHLILTGISTSGVVLSTVREAADKDFMITVLSNCCADADEEVHRVLITKIFPRQAEVLALEEWCAKF
jgi:nicotinamidase-related amidase